ncbi:methyltransferase domain-containing protein [Pseudonocardia sichuanensis]|uniref:Methyltransferase family protein n=1 Tax=Pseudonocardia kunmingensis TaxID=630975 RepID=A0A543D1G3_9PSEU|nr:methyltransferase domain-containing protein [Pseudonocardia kunmingensis]TQM03161.1 methyltransferase family protein [Pseudonocardia kunmingensis]
MGGEARQQRCDEDLAEVVAELFVHDERVRGLDVTAQVDGGVVHLRGRVDRPDQLDTVRRLVGRLAGVHAVWDRVRVGGRDPVVLDLGCGDQRQYPTNIGVDRRRTPSVAAVADVGRPLPFRDGAVDRIFAVHVLEHLIDFLPLVAECHRVLRPGGVLHVLSPWWKHVNAVADPTHVRLLDTQTIKGICWGPERPAWHPLHVGRDESTVFADLTPAAPGDEPDPRHLARFFD